MLFRIGIQNWPFVRKLKWIESPILHMMGIKNETARVQNAICLAVSIPISDTCLKYSSLHALGAMMQMMHDASIAG